jgi:hypothetical protein
MTTSALKPHILIRTYSGDKEWLQYCLASIKKHEPNIGLTVVAPKGHDVGCEYVYVDPVHQDGYVDQQFTKLHANLFVPEDTTHVVHMDSDCILIGKLSNLFIDGKPMMLKTPWEKIDSQASIWRGVTAMRIGFDPEFEYMRRMPLIYPISIYAALSNHLVEKLGPWDKWFPAIKGRKLSEFNLLGAYADKFMAEEFHWINTSTDPLPPLTVRQAWSWGGLGAVKQEWDNILAQ